MAASLAGWSSNPQVLARVGPGAITVEDFLEAARGNPNVYNGPEDSAKRLLLEDLVRRRLLVQLAEQQGFARDSAARSVIEGQVLVSALTQRLAPRPIPVSEAEIRRFYEWRSTEAHLRVIYTVSRERVDAARREIDRGGDFAEVADRFNLAGLVPPGGDLGFVTAGSLVSPLDEAVREAPVGRVQGPLPAPDEGWFLIEVIARRPRAQEPFEQMRPLLAQMLAQRKQRAVTLRASQELREQYHVSVEPSGAQVLFAHYNVPHGAGEPPPPQPSAEQRQQVLARYDDGGGRRGVYTLGDALDDLAAGAGDRPNPSLLPSFTQWILGRVMNRVVVVEARRRRLQDEPEIARSIQARFDDKLLDAIYELEVVNKAQATEQDVAATYNREAASFARLDWVRVQHLTLPDSALAVRVLERTRQSSSLKDAILASSAWLQVQEETVSFPTSDSTWASLRTSFLTMGPGAFEGPIRTADGWRIFHLVAKQQFQPPFESLSPTAQHNLRSEAEEMARDRRLTELCDSLAKATAVTRFPDRLGRVPWPPTFRPVAG
jgi:peptidyl-prolyl cis-trans isomerase C